MGLEGGPSRLWSIVLGWAMPHGHRETGLGDAAEEFAARCRREGPVAARRWYRRQAIRSVLPGLRHRIRRAPSSPAAEAGRGKSMGRWWSDLRHAVRGLIRQAGFAGTTVTVLGLGVAATTALFALFRGVFLEALPLPDADDLVVVMQASGPGCCGPASGPDYQDWRRRQRSFEGMAALAPATVTLTGLPEPERVYATRVTASAFALLQVAPALGRPLTPEDAVTGDAVVLSNELWRRLFARRADVIGMGLSVDGRTRTVVGVMPETFDVPSPWGVGRRHQLYLPLPAALLESDRANRSLPVIARLAEGVSVESAQADMDRIMGELAVEYPDTNADRRAPVFTVHEYLYGDVGNELALILVAAGLVLLIACANVAGLQLARATGRGGELAVRVALGASRRDLVRLLFTESLVLAGLGGAVGVVLAYLGLDAMKAWLPATMPRLEGVHLDGSALLFAVLVSGGTALAFGLVPSLVTSSNDVAARVREGGRGSSGPGRERLRDAFIIGQIAMGLVLANGAGLLVRSYGEIRGQDYGFETDGVLTLSLSPTGPRYEEASARDRYYRSIVERVGAIQGVRSAGLVTRLPLAGGTNGNVQVEGRPPRSSFDDGPLVEVTSAVGDYFEAMGIPLVEGRLPVADDSIEGGVGVVINRAMAEEVWPGDSPIGKRFGFGAPPPWLTVVGVVGDVRQWGPEQPPVAQAYIPYVRGWTSSGYLTARMDGMSAAVVSAVRAAITEVDPTQPPADIQGMDERLAGWLAQRRFYTTLIALFAVAALGLASAGVYGTVSYFVARRRREIGIRIALGAGGSGAMRLVLRRAVRLSAFGLLVGLAGVWGTSSVVGGLVYGVAAIDPATLVAGCVAIAVVAIVASIVPAARALRVEPSLALRAD